VKTGARRVGCGARESAFVKKRVWFITAEVHAMPGSGFPGPAGVSIYVECYVPADRIHEALLIADRALAVEKYRLHDVSRCVRFDLEDWNFDDYSADSEARKVCERVAANGEVEFGPFCFGESAHGAT
jgi:hypothetical protein